MLLITLPFFMPPARAAGFDLLWYCVILLILLEISFTTPPFGPLLFVMKGVAPPETTMRQVYTAALPFIGLEIVALVRFIAFPPLATFLPNLIAR